MMTLWRRQPEISLNSSGTEHRKVTSSRGRALARRLAPSLTLLETRTMLTATSIALTYSAPSITYGQEEVITATVATDPPSSTVPTGGTVYFNFGSLTLGSAPLTNGTATFSTTLLPVGFDEVFADYHGSGSFDDSSTTGNRVLWVDSLVSHPGREVAVDFDGDLFFTTGNFGNEIDRRDTSGHVTLFAGGGTNPSRDYSGPATGVQFSTPSGLAVYDRTLYIADTYNQVIRQVNIDSGQMSTFVGGGPNVDPNLTDPAGIAVDTNGIVYIADPSDNVIHKVVGGKIYTVAGNGTAGFSGDGGPALSAQLDAPGSITVDGSGNLFISDYSNGRIRMVDHATGKITTIAGGGTNTSPTYSGPATGATLDAPGSIVLASSDYDLFVADLDNRVVRALVYSSAISAYEISTYAGGGDIVDLSSTYSGPATSVALSFAFGLASNNEGHLFIADEGWALRDVAYRYVGPLVDVSTAPLTITADNQTWNVGQRFPVLTASYSGFVNGDTPSSLSSQPVLSTTATLGSPQGRYPITVGGASSPNYTITYVDGTLTVASPYEVAFYTSGATFSRKRKSVAILVQLSRPSKKTVTVHYGFVGGTAMLSGSIRPPWNGTITFKSGLTRKFIKFRIVKSKLPRPEVTADLRLSGPVNADLGSLVDFTITLLATGR
jgi:sugar lactone lactonase YvrE